MKLIQEMHLDKQGQRIIDAMHHDTGTSYANLYKVYRATMAFGYSMDTIIRGVREICKQAATIIGGNWDKGAHAGLFRVNSMRIEPRDFFIRANVYPEIPPMEVNVQIMEEATP